MKISKNEYEQLCEIVSQLAVAQWDIGFRGMPYDKKNNEKNQENYRNAINGIFYHFYHNIILKNGDIKEKADD